MHVYIKYMLISNACLYQMQMRVCMFCKSARNVLKDRSLVSISSFHIMRKPLQWVYHRKHAFTLVVERNITPPMFPLIKRKRKKGCDFDYESLAFRLIKRYSSHVSLDL
jgi:hypothetical protein